MESVIRQLTTHLRPLSWLPNATRVRLSVMKFILIQPREYISISMLMPFPLVVTIQNKTPKSVREKGTHPSSL